MIITNNTFELYDKVKVKEENVIGFIVFITPDNKYTVESEDNTGNIFYDLSENEIEKVST